MPARSLIPGFYGKLPSAGDFVARNLPPGFTGPWDRWLSRHLAGLPDEAPPLFFRSAGASGVVLPSHDRAGRRFPLTLAVVGTPPAAALVPLAALGSTAIAAGVAPDALAARLAAHPLRDGAADPARLLLWTDPAELHPADPERPLPVLAALLGTPARTG